MRIGKRARQNVIDVIDEAEECEQTDFMRGYVMGACMVAAALDMPKEIWASPERQQRRASSPASPGTL